MKERSIAGGCGINQETQGKDTRTEDRTARKGCVKATSRTSHAIDVTVTIGVPFRAQPERSARLARHGIGVRDDHRPSLIGTPIEPAEPQCCNLALAVGLRGAVPVPWITEVVPDVLVKVLILDDPGPKVAALIADVVLEDH